MKKICLSVFITLAISPLITYAESEFKPSPPCTVILEPTEGIPENAKGVALLYNIEREFNDKRTSLSLHALHMPNPSKFGDYDSYEVLAYIPDEISWTFKLNNYLENNWSGNLDEISPTMRPTRIKVRTIKSNTNKSGPIVLERNVSCSK
ncbi:hypothetical protein [Halalkalibacter flavus]|uniref:hypothetical protein n=1 Tax=Halalkalibacter flavus TaxID=3090668 RepID=UPI002FC66E5E